MPNQYTNLSFEERNEIKKEFLKSRMIINNSCWEWQGPLIKNRYGYTTHNFDGTKRKITCHRLAYRLWKGDISENLCVLHSCDNPKCFNPEHLHLGTNMENQMEMKERGRERKASGEKCAKSKLTENHVIEIRNLRKNGLKHREISDIFKIGLSTVHYITTYKSWKHI